MTRTSDLIYLAGLAIWCSTIIVPCLAIPDYSGLPPGPYCASRYPAGRCCLGRQDECSAPILTTTCYCDDFCNRTSEEDCCPDYWSHCRGVELPEIPAEPLRQCYANQKYYNHGETFKRNCNTCKCSSVGVRAEVLCEQNRCAIEEDILDSPRVGWSAGNSSRFWGRTLDDAIENRLGTLNPSKSVHRMNPVKRIYDPAALPRSFDSRSHWPSYKISGIRDQGWCSASWALSTIDVASDRYAIMSKGAEPVHLSAQHLLSCNNRGQQGCKGGYLDRAWLFLRKFGLVNEECYPWTGGNGSCKLRKRNINLNSANCGPQPNPLRREFYKVGPAYRLGNETDIMQEILTSGPVQATIRVYQDLFAYESGIYRHSDLAEHHRTGYHSVRIIGWGQDPISRDKYWVVANSWGTDWGEGGFFKILKGSNECEIESFVLAAWAKTEL